MSEDARQPDHFVRGATYTVRKDGSGKIEWTDLKQLARLNIRDVLKLAREKQREV